ncbi:hypothetical protein CDEF62S_01174 [Castellaniella defragrans]
MLCSLKWQHLDPFAASREDGNFHIVKKMETRNVDYHYPRG